MALLAGDAVEAEDLVAGVVADRGVGDLAEGEVLHGLGKGRVGGLERARGQGAEVAPFVLGARVVGELSRQSGEVGSRPQLLLDGGGSLLGEEVLEAFLVEARADLVAELVEGAADVLELPDESIHPPSGTRIGGHLVGDVGIGRGQVSEGCLLGDDRIDDEALEDASPQGTEEGRVRRSPGARPTRLGDRGQGRAEPEVEEGAGNRRVPHPGDDRR